MSQKSLKNMTWGHAKTNLKHVMMMMMMMMRTTINIAAIQLDLSCLVPMKVYSMIHTRMLIVKTTKVSISTNCVWQEHLLLKKQNLIIQILLVVIHFQMVPKNYFLNTIIVLWSGRKSGWKATQALYYRWQKIFSMISIYPQTMVPMETLAILNIRPVKLIIVKI